MARPELTITLNNFEKVVARMRDLGVASWVGSPVGDVILGPAPSDVVEQKKPTTKDERREYYRDVLGRHVGDQELKNLP